MSESPLAHIAERSDVRLPRPPELVAALAARAEADAAIAAAGLTIYEDREPAAKSYPFVTFYRPVGVPLPEDPTRVARVRVHVRVEVRAEDSADFACDHYHALVFAAVNGADLALDNAVLASTPRRVAGPTAAAYDADSDAYYSTAEYMAILQPNPPLP